MIGYSKNIIKSSSLDTRYPNLEDLEVKIATCDVPGPIVQKSAHYQIPLPDSHKHSSTSGADDYFYQFHRIP